MTSFLCHRPSWVTLTRMVDYARLDEELDALAADLDIDAILASIPPSEDLDAVDAALAALGEDVAPPKKPSFFPPKMSGVEAAALSLEQSVEESPLEPMDTGLSNFHAGLTPSDLQELAEIEAAEAAGKSAAAEESAPPAAASGEPESDGPPTSPSIPPLADTRGDDTGDDATSASPAAEPSVAEMRASVAPSAPPEPIFNEEDLAAIRASSPPPNGAEVEVDLEIGAVDVAEVVEETDFDELEIEELDFVEFDDDELELEMGEAVDPPPTSAAPPMTVSAPPEAMGVADLSEPPEERTVIDSSLSDDDDGSDDEKDGEKKGFFKKIFG